MLRRVVDGSQPGIDYLGRNKALLDSLVKGRVAQRRWVVAKSEALCLSATSRWTLR